MRISSDRKRVGDHQRIGTGFLGRLRNGDNVAGVGQSLTHNGLVVAARMAWITFLV